MPTTEESIVIDRSVTDVWAFASAPENQSMWQSNIDEFVVLDDGPITVGTKTRGVTKIAGRKLEWTSEYTEWDPPHKASFRSIEAPLDFSGSIRAEEVGDKATRVTWKVEAPEFGGFFGKLADPIVQRMYARDVRASLGNLKEILESEPEV